MLSEDRAAHFAHLIADGIWKDDLVDYKDEDFAMRMAKNGVRAFVEEYEEIDAKVRDMVQKLKRGVPEGSPEWDVMYRKYFEDELSKRGS